MSEIQVMLSLGRCPSCPRDEKFWSGDRLTQSGWTAMANDFAQRASEHTDQTAASIFGAMRNLNTIGHHDHTDDQNTCPFSSIMDYHVTAKSHWGEHLLNCQDQETCVDCPVIKSYYIASLLLKTDHRDKFAGHSTNVQKSDPISVAMEERTASRGEELPAATANAPDDLTSRAGLVGVKVGSLVGPTLAGLYDLTMRRVVKQRSKRDLELEVWRLRNDCLRHVGRAAAADSADGVHNALQS